MRFRQIHLDFHTNATIPGIGSRFDAKAFGKAFKDAYVDSVTVFSKCHHGVSYHPTEVGKMHPHLDVRPAARADRRAACRGHQRAGLSHRHLGRACRLRAPGVARRFRPDGSLPMFRPEAGNGAGWAFLDFSTPYLDYLCAQTEEVMRQLSRCRRHLHGHLVPAAVDLVLGQDQDGGARARLDRRARPRNFHRADRSRTTSPASATPCRSTIRRCRSSSTPATCGAACASTIPTITPTSSSRACRPPAGATSISR